jgi:hypothetical protein
MTMTEVQLRARERQAVEALCGALRNAHEKGNLFVVLEIMHDVITECDEVISENQDEDPGRHSARQALCDHLLFDQESGLDYSTD